MASVNTVYTALKNLANKDQRGFITPAVFNSFAGVAQLNVYNNLFDKLALGNAARTRQLSGERETAPLKQIREDLARFAKESTISQTSSTDQTFAKPADLGRIISAKTFGSFILGQTTSIPIDLIYDEAKIEYILRSTLSVPTETRPVALVSDVLEVYPTSIKKIKLRYYKLPESVAAVSPQGRSTNPPKFGYFVQGNVEMYDPSNSYDFELPDQYVPELVIEIAKMVGVNLRDSEVYAYAAQGQQPNQ
jgi:hypothetical protein